MTLSAGIKLAHYEITSLLGKGGMGEVYQAKDTKLGRDVAIKVLPEEFARDPGRVARFQRDAKLLASLNHPNIAAIYDLEESDGANFLVLELVEGETLADRLKRGPILVEEALKFALQTAEALEAAHEKGVIHRDLKPANIKVTPEGKVKVLDFGLAKAFAGEQADLNLSDSPTLSVAATMQGIILGTAAYMSPEQARGKPVDKRADIWAFGVVLFEMLTGKSLFAGEDVTSTLARVLEREPGFSALPANLHPRIILLLERCLKKEPKNRYHDIADARVDIQEVLADPSSVITQPGHPVKPRKKLQVGISLAAFALILCAIVAGTTVWYIKPETQPEPRRVIRFSYNLPEDRQINFGESSGNSGNSLAVSPDGSQFVFTTVEGLYLRSVDEMDAHLIPGTDEDPQSPLFSPDGQWIGYWSRADKKLKKIAVSGGAPVSLCDATWIFGAIWYPDNTIVYSEIQSGVMRVSANGGVPEPLIQVPSASPQLLPDGKSVIFTDVTTAPQYKVVVQSLESGKRKELFQGALARYLPTGHLVYWLVDDLVVLAVPFNPNTLEVTGGPVPIVEGAGIFAVSDSGTLVYVPGTNLSAQVHLEWYDRQGNLVGSAGEPGPYRQLALSPDGGKVIVQKTGSGSDLWMIDLNRAGSDIPVAASPSTEGDAVWSPNGDYIAYSSNPKGSFALYRKSVAAEEEDVLLLEPKEGNLFPEDWSRDGRYIAYLEISSEGYKIYRLPLSGEPTPEFIVGGPFNYDEPKFSPDGKTITYVSSESGRNEIWIKPLEGGRPFKVSSNGGGQPQWRDDGKELFFLALDGAIMAVDMGENLPTPGLPKPLFQTSIYVDPTIDQYAVTGDGMKFLILNQEGADISSINVIINWFEELRARAPVE